LLRDDVNRSVRRKLPRYPARPTRLLLETRTPVKRASEDFYINVMQRGRWQKLLKQVELAADEGEEAVLATNIESADARREG